MRQPGALRSRSAARGRNDGGGEEERREAVFPKPAIRKRGMK